MRPGTVVSLRARWAGNPPAAGTWFITGKGAVYRLVELWEGGCGAVRVATAPQGVKLRQWSDLVARDASPPVRRSNRDHLQSLLRRGAISERQYAAAVRFRQILEHAVPAVPVGAGRLERLGVRGSSGHPVQDAHLHARRAAVRAISAVGGEYAPVLNWCVVANGSTAGYAAHAGTRETRAADQLRAALTRLDSHYNPAVYGRAR